MRKNLHEFRLDVRSPWQWALFLIAVIPLFPEYISFFLVTAAVILSVITMKKEQIKPEIGTIGKALLLFIGYSAVSVLWANDKWQSAATVLMWLWLYLVYFILVNLLNDRDRTEILLFYITAVAGAVGLIACCQYRVGLLFDCNPIMFWEWLDQKVYALIPFNIIYPQYNLRSCSTFSNPNVLSEFLTLTAPFVVYFNFYERREHVRIFTRICLILTFGGIMFSFSRGGYIAAGILLITLIILNVRHRFTAVTLYVIATLLIIPEEVLDRMITIKSGVSSGTHIIEDVASSTTITYSTTASIIENAPAEIPLDSRWAIWLESLNSIKERVLFGYGAGIQSSRGMLSKIGPYVMHSHNQFLQFLLEGGIVGLLLMGLVGFLIFRYGFRLFSKGYGNASFWIGFAILGFAVSFCVVGMVDVPLLTPKLIGNFMVLCALTEKASKLFPMRHENRKLSRLIAKRKEVVHES